VRNRPEGSFFDMHGSTTIALTFLLLSAIAAQAQSFDLLYTFRGSPDSNSSSTSLVQDTAGNLYGTAGGGAYGLGTVFKLDPSGTETVLHSFAGGIGDGEFPQAGLRLDKNGNLYGTTNLGGKTSNGVVFKIDPTGNETIVYNFAGGTTDGCYPLGGLVMDKNGRLYGTTERTPTGPLRSLIKPETCMALRSAVARNR